MIVMKYDTEEYEVLSNPKKKEYLLLLLLLHNTPLCVLHTTYYVLGMNINTRAFGVVIYEEHKHSTSICVSGSRTSHEYYVW